MALSRRSFLTGGAAVAVTGPTLWAQAARATVPVAGVHLAAGADPARAMALSWSTAEPVRGAVLELGLDDSYGLTVPGDTRSAPLVATNYHHAALDGLDPDTTYRYRISHDGGVPFTGSFTTAPARPRAFRFATFGDMGVSAGAAENLARIVQNQVDLCFVVGDLCYADYSGGSSQLTLLPQNPATWDAWLAQIQPSAATTPWMATVGNHEMERGSGDLGYDGYLARFSLPGGGPGPVTYAFRWGNVGFVALDGNDASFEIDRNRGYLGSAQDTWLDATLAGLRAHRDVDFIVVGFHNCMYCTNAFHGSDGGNRGRWRDLLERHGVDLVVNGHNHCYERTHPLRGDEPVGDALNGAVIDAASGTTYLTAGGGGQAEYPTGTWPVSYVVEEGPPGVYGGVRVPEPATWSAVRRLTHSIAVVDVEPATKRTPATMTVRGLARDGSEFDRVTLVRHQVRR